MSAMVLDKSLDSIIADKKKNNRRPRPRANAHSAKSKLVGKGGTPAVAAKKRASVSTGGATAPAPNAVGTSAATAVKIIVSNLPTDVNEAQVKDLFQSTVGPTKHCMLNYNAAGKSSGIATVVFAKQGDAQKAFDTYNNRLIDGKRPMKIEIVFDPAKQPLVNRVAAAKPAKAATSTVAAAAGGGAPARGGRPKRGRGGGRAGGKRPHKTAEDLDAEMADYTKGADSTTA